MVQDKGIVEMKDLQVGDSVLTAGAQKLYQPIYAFGHYEPDTVGEFLALVRPIPLEPLKMTPDHLIYLQNKSHPIVAGKVKVGDILQDGTTITSIQSYQDTGLYVPLTHDGTLMLEGAPVSSYIALYSDHSEYVEWPLFGQWMSHHDFVHWTLAPFRVLCNLISSEWCYKLTDNGIPPYIEWGIDAVQWAHGYGGIVEIGFLFWAFVLFTACRLVEVSVSDKGLIMVAIALVTAMVWRRRYQHKTKTV